MDVKFASKLDFSAEALVAHPGPSVCLLGFAISSFTTSGVTFSFGTSLGTGHKVQGGWPAEIGGGSPKYWSCL